MCAGSLECSSEAAGKRQLVSVSVSIPANEGRARAGCHRAAARGTLRGRFSSSTQTLDECRRSTPVRTDPSEKHFALEGPAGSAERKRFVPAHDLLSVSFFNTDYRFVLHWSAPHFKAFPCLLYPDSCFPGLCS